MSSKNYFGKSVYCHTSGKFDIIKHSVTSEIKEGDWYGIYEEKLEYYSIFGIFTFFYKTSSSKSDHLFSDYFYTEQEYNRIKGLNELLDGE